jgi:OFA family oxalate/formate antiporter-like MFS transporter
MNNRRDGETAASTAGRAWWRSGWGVLAGSGFGGAFGTFVLFAYGYPALSTAMRHSMSWSPSQIALGTTIYLLCQTAVQPICGQAVARWGSRRVAIVSIASLAASLVLLSVIGGSLIGFYIGMGLIAATGAGTNPLAYAQAIAGWFGRRRGLAFGISGGAGAIGLVSVPWAAARALSEYGWEETLRFAAVFELAVCLPLVALLVHDRTRSSYPANDTFRSDADSGDLWIITDVTFWLMAAAFFCMGVSIYSVVPNTVEILKTIGGLDVSQIVFVQSAGGIAFLLGRLGSGYLLDRISPLIVAVLLTLLISTKLIVYANSSNYVLIVLATMLSGFSVGGEGDLMPFLAGRYFGTERIAKVYGLHLLAFFLGAALGPLLYATLSSLLSGMQDALLTLASVQFIPLLVFAFLLVRGARTTETRKSYIGVK